MGRAERRRLEKQRGKQVKTYNLTRSQLHNAVRQVTDTIYELTQAGILEVVPEESEGK